MPSAGKRELPGLSPAMLATCAGFAVPTLMYPYGRDQGLFHYVGSEWLKNGAVPYRDSIEHRPPGLHFLYGVLALGFGDRSWPIRLVDALLVFTLGLTCVAIMTVRGERASKEAVAFGVLFPTVLYFGFFDYWNTAQIDFVYMVLCFYALAAVRRFQRPALAIVVAGWCVGLALVIKPPAVFLGACVGLAIAQRAWAEGVGKGRIATQLGAYVAFAALPWLATIAYFAAKGALGDLWLWNFSVNAYYAVNERGANSLGEVLIHGTRAFARFSPYSIALLALLGISALGARARGDAETIRRHAGVVALCFAAWLGVAVQMKFYWYHHAVLVGPLTLLALSLCVDFQRWAEAADWSKLRRRSAPALFTLLAFPLSLRFVDWWSTYRDSLRFALGELPKSIYYLHFQHAHFSASDNWDVADWLAKNSRSTDSVAVRGFEPQIYIMAERRYRGSRFFWTNFITDSRRSMLHDQWLAEEDAAFRRNPPRFVVAICERGLLACADWHQERAPYAERKQFGAFRILELLPGQPTQQR